MKSSKCTVYLMTKYFCNQPLHAYGVSAMRHSICTSYITMDSPSQWEWFKFSAAYSYLWSKYVEKQMSSLLFSPHSTLLQEKNFLSSVLCWKLCLSIQQRERKKILPHQTLKQMKSITHLLYWTLMLTLICTLMYTSKYCTITNTAI